MSSFEAARLHASDAVRQAQADRLARVFDLAVRGRSPALANALAATPNVAAIITAAIVALAERSESCGAVKAFETLWQNSRAMLQSDGVVGQALIAALTEVIGPTFDQASREAWTQGYIHLVEIVMAARRNRMDLVA